MPTLQTGNKAHTLRLAKKYWRDGCGFIGTYSIINILAFNSWNSSKRFITNSETSKIAC